jgi:NTP pyrophosphatase (non-canonical NTP hydrolase)
MTVPVPSDSELRQLIDQIDAFAAALRPFQAAVHRWMRRYGRYELIDRVVQQAPDALPFVYAAQLAHIHSEAAEAYEEIRDMSAEQEPPADTDRYAIELADVLLALVDAAEFSGRDLGAALKAKVTQEPDNPHRPRAF